MRVSKCFVAPVLLFALSTFAQQRESAQSRIWGYSLEASTKQDEGTKVLVDSSIKDDSPSAQDPSPLSTARAFEQEPNVDDQIVALLAHA
ncbi:MAG: hypothetical protein NVS1B11_37650 [Terriglobales bacterium]